MWLLIRFITLQKSFSVIFQLALDDHNNWTKRPKNEVSVPGYEICFMI